MSKKIASGTGRWVTINGCHVFIQGGVITKGPASLVGKPTGIPDPFKDSRTSNTVNLQGSVSILSTQADARHLKKEIAETKKINSELKNELKKSRELTDRRHEIQNEYKNATVERKIQLKKEADKLGMHITTDGKVKHNSVKSSESAEKVSLTKQFQKEIIKATTTAEKEKIISEAKKQTGHDFKVNGEIKPNYKIPSKIVKIKGLTFDLSVKDARKEAINMSVFLSPENKIKFNNILLGMGFDPLTGKPLK